MGAGRDDRQLARLAVHPYVLDLEIRIVKVRRGARHPVVVTDACACLLEDLLVACVVW